MFDIGWSELLVVGVVALVVVGPKDLPKLMRTAGQWAGRARAMADQFKRSFDDMARQSELEELRKEVERMKTDTMLDDIVRETNIMPPELNALVSEVQATGTSGIASAPESAAVGTAPQAGTEAAASAGPSTAVAENAAPAIPAAAPQPAPSLAVGDGPVVPPQP